MSAYSLFSRSFRSVWIALALVALHGSLSSVRAEAVRPTPHEWAAIEARGGSRLWYHEQEFELYPLLRAEPHQVVILHLEPRDNPVRDRGHNRRRKLVHNIIPYRFTETADYSFCVPKDDPHIRSLELRSEDSHGVVVHVRRGATCKTREVAAGLYQLDVEHDGSRIGAAGEKAFVHVPRIRDTSLPRAASATLSCGALSVIMDSKSQFVIRGMDKNATLQSSPTTDLDLSVGGWQFCSVGSGLYVLKQPVPVAGYPPDNGLYVAKSAGATDSVPGPVVMAPNDSSDFLITDMGNYQFSMIATFFSSFPPSYPIFVGADNLLHYGGFQDPGPETFSTPVKYYLPGDQVPPLQKGEVALFHGCNYDTSHGTWVIRANLPNSAIYYYKNPFLGTLDHVDQTTTGLSLRLGPLTVATLYYATHYNTNRGPSQTFGEDTLCASDDFYVFGSVTVTDARDFIVATGNCDHCNLSGIDLSGLDISSGSFLGSTFNGANLTSTNLHHAQLDWTYFPGKDTLLTNANFSDASIMGANFIGAELSQANFRSTIPGILDSGNTNRPILTSATLDLDTFSLSDWRWLNLTNATINRVVGATLSTPTAPLDLSGALLSNVDLRNVKLDGANLGCTTYPADNSTYCSRLNDVNLNGASLKKTVFNNALLQGAELASANLDSANLCGAKLNKSPDTQKSARLHGAFLHNVNLAQADLTGADLTNANFYSSFVPASGTCLPSANCGATPNCASAVNAALAGASLSGAYLVGVDFSGANLQGADLSHAFLVGANFTNGNFSEDATTGRRTLFGGAYLQGAKFTNANVIDAIFDTAYVDITSSNGATLLMQLSSDNLQFTGYQATAGSTPGCVEATYSHQTTLPITGATNVCPDGSSGPCTSASQWVSRIPPPALPANCTFNTTDFNWLFPPP